MMSLEEISKSKKVSSSHFKNKAIVITHEELTEKLL